MVNGKQGEEYTTKRHRVEEQQGEQQKREEETSKRHTGACLRRNMVNSTIARNRQDRQVNA